MSIEVQGVTRVRVIKETTFGTDLSGSIASFKDVRFNTFDARLTQELLQDQRAVQRFYAEPMDVLGRKAAELTLGMHLEPLGTAIDNAAGALTDPNSAQGVLLKAMMGGWSYDAGSLCASGASSTGCTVTGGQGGRFLPGQVVFLPTGTGNTIEARVIKTRSTDAITWKVATSSSIGVGEAVYNSHTFHMTDDPAESLQFVVESNERDDIWWLLGLAGGFSFDLPLNALPTLTASLRGANWKHDDDIGTPLGSVSSLAVATLTDGDPVPFISSEVLFEDATTTTRTPIDISAISISPNITFEPVSSPSGVNGILRYRARRQRPMITGSFTTYFETEGYWEKRDARTKMALTVQVGNVAGKVVFVELPCVQITDVQRADSEGLIGQTVSFKAMEDEYATDQTLEKRRSPMRIAW